MNPIRRTLHAVAAALVAFSAFAVLAVVIDVPPASAAVVDAMTLDYDQEVFGDFILVGNASLKCQDTSYTGTRTYTDAQCATAATRTSNGSQSPDVNDNYFMVNNQVSGASGTINSSTATLTIPAGAIVDYAKLSWAANTGDRGNGSGGMVTRECATNPPTKAVKPAGSPSTQTLGLKVGSSPTVAIAPADYEYTVDPTPATSTAQYYSADSDVTEAFTDAPTGSALTVDVQDVWAPQGFGCFGGWSLYLVWKFPSANATHAPNKREVFIYDGHVRQAQADPTTSVNLSGFRVAGGAANRVGVTAYEGDWGITGDQFLINDQAVTDPYSGGVATNFFVSDSTGDANPSYANNFSIDAKSFPVSTAVIAPGSTTAKLSFSTAGDSYLAQNFAVSVPIPSIHITKVADRSTARPGDLVTYTITVGNTTDIPAINVVVSDPLYPAQCNRTIGNLAAQSESTYTCQAPAGTADFANGVTVTATNSFGDVLTDSAESGDIDVTHPGLSLTKSATPDDVAPGDTVTWSLTVTNTGDQPLTSVHVADALVPACDRPALGSLAVGAFVTYSCTSVAGAAGLTNSATATGTDPENRTVDVTATGSYDVTAPAAAAPDTDTTPQGVAVTVSPLGNDTPGTGATFTASSVQVRDPGTGTWGTTATVPGEGTYEADADGTVTFDPAPTFTGTAAPVDYRVTDTNGSTAASTITITVTPITPTALDDARSTKFGTPVTVTVLANDDEGAASAPLVPSTVRLLDETESPVTTLTVPGEGTWEADADGTVTFAPEAGFTGLATPVIYQVADANGTTTSAELAVTVTDGPKAAADTDGTPQDTDVTLSPLDNDTPGTDATYDPSSVQLFDPGTATWGATVTVAGEGTFTAHADGTVTLDPLPAFTGTTSVLYRATDTDGHDASAAITVDVTPIVPTAADDDRTTPYDTPVTVTVAANDDPGAPSAPLDLATVRLLDAGTPATTVTVAGEGTYDVNPDGTITFTPEAGFTGTATPQPYRIADVNGTTATAVLTVTVTAGPEAAPDEDATLQDVPVTVDVLGNDTPGAGATFDPATVEVLDPDAGTWGPSATVPGEGTWTVEADGSITFDPIPSFTGTATTVGYRADDTDGNPATSTVTVTVAPVNPTAVDDSRTTAFATPVTVTVAANDLPGHASAPLDATTVRLLDGGTPATTLTVAGEGTYDVNADGTITFTPGASFTGTTTPQPYRMADDNGTTTDATLTVTVTAGPEAVADSATTPQDVTVTLSPLGNDTPGVGASFVPATLELRDPGTQAWGTTVAVPGEGTWTAAPDGSVAFDPIPGFTGPATPIRYRADDTDANPATEVISVTVTPITPTADDDARSTPFETPVTVTVLANDDPGAASAPLDPSSVALADGASWATTLTVAGEGTYDVDADGTITFTPADGFEGVTTPVTYRVADTNGTTATAVLSITVTDGPRAAADADTTPQDVDVTVSVLGNDTPGAGASFDPTTVVLFDPATTTWGAGLTIDGEGTYAAAADGTITFDPEPTFTGTSSALYRVTDSGAADASALLTITVTPVSPTAADDDRTTPYATPITVDVLGNDSEGHASAPLDATTVRLLDGGTPATTLTVAGEGTFDVNADGSVTFTPADGFSGTTGSVAYQVADANGTLASALVTVTVTAGPEAVDDGGTSPQDTDVTVAVLANDTPGGGATFDAATVELQDPTTALWGTTVTVPGEGTHTVDPSGTVTFDPEPAFTGPATPIRYRVSDTDGNETAATVTITVTPITPTASDDARTTKFAKPVTATVLANDLPGDPSAALDPGSVVLLDGTTPVTTLAVPGEGTYDVHADGTITFTPEAGFHGVTTPVTYRVADDNGTTATAELVVTVTEGPVASPDTGGATPTDQNVDVTIDPLVNDTPGTDATFDPASVQLFDPGTGTWGDTATIPGEGTYTVGPDGTVTFDPHPDFTGTSTVIYRVTDTDGNDASSTITVVVSPITPAAADDARTTPYRTPVTVTVLANDTEGAPSAPLDADTVRLLDAGSPVTSLDVPGEGTYDVNADGTITFTPDDAFEGAATPVPYRVADANGTPATALLAITVTDGPRADPDDTITPQDVDVTLAPLDDDTPGTGATFDPASVELFDAATTTWGTTLTVPGEGTYTVGPDGTVTFDPEPAFTGTTSAVYRATDTDGNDASSTITVLVTPIVPSAFDDHRTTPYNAPVTIDELANDVEGAPSAPLDATTVHLLDGSDPVDGLVVDGEGSWFVEDDGRITFTPEPGYHGTTTPVPYRVADANGTTTEATVTVTVTDPGAPAAMPNAEDGETDQPLTLTPLDNDTPSLDADWDPTSVCLMDGAGACVKSVDILGQGTFTVNDDGTVTFTPEPGFAGEATVPYATTDTNGMTADSTITVTYPEVGGPSTTTTTTTTTSTTTEPTTTTGPGTTTEPTPADPASADAPGEAATGSLPRTGAEVLRMVPIGLALLAGGSLLLLAGRRRAAARR
jgi:uncharacterized repeat protein (TIGR01451 family)